MTLQPAIHARVEALLRDCKQAARQFDVDLNIDMSFLTERARLNGFPAPTHISSNGACHLIKASDGWIAVNLAREEDIAALPAWIDCGENHEPWAALEHAAGSGWVKDLTERGQTLGIPVAPAHNSIPDDVQFRNEVVKRTRLTPGLCRAARKPLVVDLSSLWAGPLCGHILAGAGAHVVKIESPSRPDGARFGNPIFFDSLNKNKEQLTLDLKSDEGKAALLGWIERADVVIESARPRAMQQMGFDIADMFARNPFLCWVSITAYGREGPWSNHVGFGDDAAAAGGLLTWTEGGTPGFIGDAIADPLAGLFAATAALRVLSEGGGVLLDVSLREAAAFIART